MCSVKPKKPVTCFSIWIMLYLKDKFWQFLTVWWDSLWGFISLNKSKVYLWKNKTMSFRYNASAGKMNCITKPSWKLKILYLVSGPNTLSVFFHNTFFKLENFSYLRIIFVTFHVWNSWSIRICHHFCAYEL